MTVRSRSTLQSDHEAGRRVAQRVDAAISLVCVHRREPLWLRARYH
jgi:hypothetical protein